MTLAQREHPEAVAEFDAAVRWYEDQEPGIGLALIDRARQARKDPVFSYAHEQGHASGYEEIENYLIDLVQLVRVIQKN